MEEACKSLANMLRTAFTRRRDELSHAVAAAPKVSSKVQAGASKRPQSARSDF